MSKRHGLFSGLFSNVDLSLLNDIPALITRLQSPEKAKNTLEGRDAKGYTLLHHAASSGCVEALNILLSHNGKHYCNGGLLVQSLHGLIVWGV